ncbi:MAG: hypothetical protein COA33_010150 [Fluviicola sp.]|nr:hypothetical protein [Fluviicola sp.]
MRNCEEISNDIERGRYKKLSVKELIAIKMHLLICRPCADYKKDSDLIDLLLQKKYENGAPKYEFSEEEKLNLKNACNKDI